MCLPGTGRISYCLTLQRFEAAGCVCPQTGQVHPLPPPVFVSTCHTKVLICSARTCFTVCLLAGKQAHHSSSHCHNLSFQIGIERMCVCLQRRQVCSYPLRTFAGLYCTVVCLGHFLLAVYLLLTLGTSVSIGPCLCASRAVFFSWCCGAPLFRCCCSGCLGVVVVLLLLALVAWVLAVGPALSRFPPFPFPLGCLLVFSGPVSCLLVPPSGYLVVSATVRLPYLWHGVSWLIGSCLHSASWQQRLRPCVGLCPLHHVVGAVHGLINARGDNIVSSRHGMAAETKGKTSKSPSHKSTMRKGSRIPEITWHRPSRHNNSHIVTSKQTTATP